MGITPIQVRGEGATNEPEQATNTRTQIHGSEVLHLASPHATRFVRFAIASPRHLVTRGKSTTGRTLRR
jgi:hypothetical protein